MEMLTLINGDLPFLGGNVFKYYIPFSLIWSFLSARNIQMPFSNKNSARDFTDKKGEAR
jgi:hypothetical protein